MSQLNLLRQRMQQAQKLKTNSRLVLFVGTTATAKATAEELAKETHKPLIIVSLAQIISQYIGETEKNLDAIFRRAEAAKAVLLFDEADALFGKRSPINDAHDRYANAAVSSLLKRIEAYPWPSILLVQKKHNLDEAFTRRFHHTVRFPLV